MNYKELESAKLMNKLRDMDLHSSEWNNELNMDIARVPGGWIYSSWDATGESIQSQIFVPWINQGY